MKKFTPDTLRTKRGSNKIGPTILFSANGKIILNTNAIELLGIKDGSCISLFQDEKEEKIWHIAVDKAGYEVKMHKEGKSANFSNKNLCDYLWKSVGSKENESLSCKIANEPEKEHDGLSLYALLVYIPVYDKNK